MVKIIKWMIYLMVVIAIIFHAYYWKELQEISNAQDIYESSLVKSKELTSDCVKGMITGNLIIEREKEAKIVMNRIERTKAYFKPCEKGLFTTYNNKVCFKKGIDFVLKKAMFLKNTSEYFSKESCKTFLYNDEIYTEKRKIIAKMKKYYQEVKNKKIPGVEDENNVEIEKKITTNIEKVKAIALKEIALFKELLQNSDDMIPFIETLKEMSANEEKFKDFSI